MAVGSPISIIDKMVDRSKDLTIICNVQHSLTRNWQTGCQQAGKIITRTLVQTQHH